MANKGKSQWTTNGWTIFASLLVVSPPPPSGPALPHAITIISLCPQFMEFYDIVRKPEINISSGRTNTHRHTMDTQHGIRKYVHKSNCNLNRSLLFSLPVTISEQNNETRFSSGRKQQCSVSSISPPSLADCETPPTVRTKVAQDFSVLRSSDGATSLLISFGTWLYRAHSLNIFHSCRIIGFEVVFAWLPVRQEGIVVLRGKRKERMSFGAAVQKFVVTISGVPHRQQQQRRSWWGSL